MHIKHALIILSMDNLLDAPENLKGGIINMAVNMYLIFIQIEACISQTCNKV